MQTTMTSPVYPATVLGSPRLVVIDDSPIITDALSRLLMIHGYDVVTFNAALAAIDYVRTNPVDGALVDVHMPDLSGLIVSQQLRSLMGPDAPIIVLSGDVSMEVLNALKHVGATHFFPKPLQPAMLLDRLRQLFDISPMEMP